MYLNFKRFYRIRFLGALFVLGLALIYLAGGEKFSLIGFAIITLFVVVGGDKLRKGTMPAICDLCQAGGTMKAEYGAGFSNARLVLRCPRCGRVINAADEGVDLRAEKK